MFLKELLECIEKWAKNYPLDKAGKQSKFAFHYTDLMKRGVSFPSMAIQKRSESNLMTG
jgi:hypothetical protein